MRHSGSGSLVASLLPMSVDVKNALIIVFE